MKKIYLFIFLVLILLNFSPALGSGTKITCSGSSCSPTTTLNIYRTPEPSASSEGDILEGATTITPTPQASPSIQDTASCHNPSLWLVILAFLFLILASVAKSPPKEKRLKILFGIFITTILCLGIISRYFCSWLLILASGTLGLASLIVSSRKLKKTK